MPIRTRVLFADESASASSLTSFLERSGLSVSIAVEGEEALALISSFGPDIIIIDVLLPLIGGREVLRQLRGDGNWTPIIILGEVGDATERAMALDEGADDYMLKPIAPQELIARMKAILRRVDVHTQPALSASNLISGDLHFDRIARRVCVGVKLVKLTAKALDLLEYLMTHPGEILTREHLLDVVWGWDFPLGTRSVDTRIAELRSALQDNAKLPEFIETVHGYGYRFLGDVRVIPLADQTRTNY